MGKEIFESIDYNNPVPRFNRIKWSFLALFFFLITSGAICSVSQNEENWSLSLNVHKENRKMI
jgi:hypothetical protein